MSEPCGGVGNIIGLVVTLSAVVAVIGGCIAGWRLK